ncbi:MAG: mannitol dehydrogenase family protein, partial [Lysobacteraceae bacterium]
MILQFGTSRFLQAHVDLFASEARDAGQTVADIAIVQVSDDPLRARRLAAFDNVAGFPVVIRGLEGGVPVERTVQVRSVVRGLAAAHDWSELCALFVGRFLMSCRTPAIMAIRFRPRIASRWPTISHRAVSP